MTTAEHVAAVEAAIQAAGGPDCIRFCPISIELVERAVPTAPVTAEVRQQESGLVDIFFTEL